MDVEIRIARTYHSSSYNDSYDAVSDYQRVQRVASNHPDKKSTALSNIVGLPRGRIRSWVDGDGMPDPARGVLTARSKSWINFDPSDEIAASLAALAGHILGGGSIASESYVPAVAEGRRASLSDIESAFRSVGVRATRRHSETSNRATAVIPADNASILGRTPVAWGVPLGQTKPTELPELLDHVDDEARRRFVTAYILHRGTNAPDKATSQCLAEYPLGFQRAIAELIEELTGERATASEGAVTVSAAAMRELGVAEE